MNKKADMVIEGIPNWVLIFVILLLFVLMMYLLAKEQLFGFDLEKIFKLK